MVSIMTTIWERWGTKRGWGIAVALPLLIAFAPAVQAQPSTSESRTSESRETSHNAYNYVGGGISDEGWVINSKAQLTSNLSTRPTALIDYDFDDVKVLVPVTYDFPAVEAGGAELLPFGGAGVSFATQGDDHFNALITGGVDYRFAEKWTATGAANLSFAGDTDLDLTVGVGYTF